MLVILLFSLSLSAFPSLLAEAAAREAALNSNPLHGHSEYAPPPPSVIAPSRQSGAAEARIQMMQQEEEEGERELICHFDGRLGLKFEFFG